MEKWYFAHRRTAALQQGTRGDVKPPLSTSILNLLSLKGKGAASSPDNRSGFVNSGTHTRSANDFSKERQKKIEAFEFRLTSFYLAYNPEKLVNVRLCFFITWYCLINESNNYLIIFIKCMYF